MSGITTGVVAWRMGRSWSAFHLTGDDLWKTLCSLAVPQKPLDTVTRIRGRSKEPTCRSCLKALDRLALDKPGSLKQERV